MKRAVVLAMGDITLDLAAAVDEEFPEQHTAGADLTFAGSPTPSLGGTAMLLARAAESYPHVRPLMIAGLGADRFASFVLAEVESRGLDAVGLQVVPEAATCVVSLSYFSDGTRFMIRPRSHAGRRLDRNRVGDLLRGLSEDPVALLFISGYLLVEPSSPSVLAVQEACRWATARDVPVVVDLVPHEFKAMVGDMSTLIERVGCKPNGYVAELRTIRDLGMCDGYTDRRAARRNMVSGSAELAHYGDFAVVQHQDEQGVYSQAVTWFGRSEPLAYFPFGPNERLGLGDRLLLQALHEHHYLDPATSSP